MRRQSTPRLRLGRPLSSVGGGLAQTLAAAATALAFSAAALAGPVTLAATGLAVATGIADLSTGDSYITPSVTMSRTSGASPLVVHFDASATVASFYTLKPFHHIEYRFEFGDGTSGEWQRGILPGTLPRNVSYGAIAVHSYEPSVTTTFNPVCQMRVRRPDGSFDVITHAIGSVNVTGGDAAWPGTQTICYSVNSDFTDAPDGCVQVPNVTDISAEIEARLGSGNKRHLLHDAQTFPQTTNLALTVGNGDMLGKFGSGAKPVVRRDANHVMVNLSSGATPKTVNDWRIADVIFDGNGFNNLGFYGAGSFRQLTLLRTRVEDISFGMQLSASVMNGLNAGIPHADPLHHDLWDEVYVIDSEIVGLTGDNISGHNGIIGSGRRVAVVGCLIDPLSGGEHGMRWQTAERSVFQHNTIQGIAAGKTNMTIRGDGFAGTNTIPAGQYSEKNIVSWNHFVGVLSGGMCGDGPQNGDFDERGRDHIWEYNFYEGGTSNSNVQTIAQPNCTFRYNTFKIGAGGFIKVEKSRQIPAPTGLEIYGNSGYSSQTGSFFFIDCAINIGPLGTNDNVPVPGSVDIFSANNLMWGPNIAASVSMHQNLYGAGTFTTPAGTNTTNAQVTGTNPLYANMALLGPADFKPGSGSYAVGAGHKTAGAYIDTLRVAVLIDPDIGAVVH